MVSEKPCIVLEDISKTYCVGEIENCVLNKTSIQVKKGDIVVMLGPSGCGKTTVLNIIGGIDRPTEGRILVDSVEITNLDNSQLARIRRDRIGFVFQFCNLIPTLTALENVELALEIMHIKRRGIKERAISYLQRVGLKEKTDRYPAQLSGGEQQRVAIARALAKEPAIILADEPTGNLDRHTEKRVIQLIKELNTETKTTFLIATHNQKLAEIADHIIHIDEGHIIAE